MRKNLVVVAALSAFALAPSAWAAAGGAPDADVDDFAKALASTARSAEIAANPRDAATIQRQVATTVEELIVTAARPPANVRLALQQTVYTCIRPAEAQRLGYECPGSPAAIDGLRDVLNTVTALIDGSSTATVGGAGDAAILPPPALQAGAGSDYRQLQ